MTASPGCQLAGARTALKTQEAVSTTFCYCSVSWDKQLREGILERTVKVEIVKSLLKGDRHGVHALHLSQGVH